ncbi:short-chain dehydrogenase, putative [Babesia ovis]|uniref:Short-chain dehydrogenase, putative n=1 Tax=Babesia ovis TaxID=5869 RepID=A0A9W5TAU0_BABOV|nr:short-chain dehydrogenase, putative [Babesia ovis]
MAPKYDHVIFPVPTKTASGEVPTLPTNEDNALVVVEDSAHEDVDNIAEEEELLKGNNNLFLFQIATEPVPELEIAAEREKLQEEGKLPPGDGEVLPPSDDSSGTYYNEGVKETSEMLGDATHIVENDGAETGGNDEAQLTKDLEDRLDVLQSLPSQELASIIKPAQ